jgi:hypothetical protein
VIEDYLQVSPWADEERKTKELKQQMIQAKLDYYDTITSNRKADLVDEVKVKNQQRDLMIMDESALDSTTNAPPTATSGTVTTASNTNNDLTITTSLSSSSSSSPTSVYDIIDKLVEEGKLTDEMNQLVGGRASSPEQFKNHLHSPYTKQAIGKLSDDELKYTPSDPRIYGGIESEYTWKGEKSTIRWPNQTYYNSNPNATITDDNKGMTNDFVLKQFRDEMTDSSEITLDISRLIPFAKEPSRKSQTLLVLEDDSLETKQRKEYREQIETHENLVESAWDASQGR